MVDRTMDGGTTVLSFWLIPPAVGRTIGGTTLENICSGSPDIVFQQYSTVFWVCFEHQDFERRKHRILFGEWPQRPFVCITHCSPARLSHSVP